MISPNMYCANYKSLGKSPFIKTQSLKIKVEILEWHINIEKNILN